MSRIKEHYHDEICEMQRRAENEEALEVMIVGHEQDEEEKVRLKDILLDSSNPTRRIILASVRIGYQAQSKNTSNVLFFNNNVVFLL